MLNRACWRTRTGVTGESSCISTSALSTSASEDENASGGDDIVKDAFTNLVGRNEARYSEFE